MFDTFLTLIKTKFSYLQDERLLLAVSGGVDSMVLLDLAEKADLNYAVVHVNYGLRGKESDLDEDLVVEKAREFGRTFVVRKVKDTEWEKGASIQMNARNIRYSFFKEVMDKGFSRLLTAHHIKDNLETLLLNLSKGTGISGLTGMPEKNDYVVRPLLHFSRTEILEYATTNELIWREDQSNQSDKYQRNIIRNEVVPHLKRLNDRLEWSIDQTIDRLKGAEQALIKLKNGILDEYFQPMLDSSRLQLDWLDDSHLNNTILFEILKPYGINSSQLENIISAHQRNNSGKQFLTETHKIVLDRSSLLIAEKQSDAQFESVEIDSSIKILDLPEGRLHQTIESAPMGISKDINIAMLDYQKLNFPLKVRRWQKGDWFVPLGITGRKLISDFMIDAKIPLILKEKVLVVTSGQDIVWIIGHRLDNRYKVTSKTKRILKLSYEVF